MLPFKDMTGMKGWSQTQFICHAYIFAMINPFPRNFMTESKDPDSSDQVQAMLDANKHQAKFYNPKTERKINSISKFWKNLRVDNLGKYRHSIGIADDIFQRHIEWMGDLKGKRVLDLGVFRGNRLTPHMAENAEYYLGIDLSTEGIQHLRKKLDGMGLQRAEVRTQDFLAPDFKEDNFDVIYAYGVLHHFRHFEAFIKRMHEKLAPGGIIVSYDPLETYPLNWLARRIYRPFQTDSAWEWPFSRTTFRTISRYFTIDKIQGTLGKSKKGWFYSFLPFYSADKVARMGKQWHQQDLQEATSLGPKLYNCMQVAMRLRKDK